MGTDILLPNAVILTQASRVKFTFDDLQPPSNVYITPQEFIFVTVHNISSGATTFSFRARILMPDGTVTIIQDDHASIDSAGGQQQYSIQVVEGYLLNAELRVASVALRGQVYGQVELARGAPSAGRVITGMLMQDYLSVQTPLSWPGNTPRSSVDGPGFITTLQIPNPAAGAEFTLTTSAGLRQKLRCGACTFQTSAVVNNRQPRFLIRDAGGHSVWETGINADVIASTTTVIGIGNQGVTNATEKAVSFWPLPGDIVIGGSFTLLSSTNRLDVADQYSSIWFLVEQWQEP